jgi:uncharacterized membrane protein YfcA
MLQALLFAAVGFVGGVFGSMVGLGGGIFIIPCLTLFLDVPIHSAIAAGLVAVIATSTSGSAAYLRRGLVNLRLAVCVETVLAAGALTGGLVGAMLDKTVLSVVFGAVMIGVSFYMGLGRAALIHTHPEKESLGSLGGDYHDAHLGQVVRYRVRRLPVGLFAGLVAGNISGLLGVGGGFMTVPAMALIMGVPMRAAAATSSLMLGVTACAGAVVYFARGMVDPTVAVPVVLGVTAGALLGSRLALKVRQSVLAGVLAVMLLALSLQMILAAAGIRVR